jgi:hypothetical protein
VFFVVVLAVLAGILGYLWLRLVRDTTAGGRGRRVGTAAIVLFALVIVGGLVGSRTLPHAVATPRVGAPPEITILTLRATPNPVRGAR